ncbi:MAG: stage II sporulation protein M [Anaerolineae bacterium]|nr:stage II sporulation protein M [Anaerolineae bacterium]
MIPPLTASFGGMTFYLITLYWRGAIWQPPLMLVIQMFILTIVQALVMVAGAVVVSSQTTSARAANLLASFIIVPMTMIVNVESVIIFLAPDGQSQYGIFALWWIALGMVVAAILLLRVGNSIFNREELLGRAIDSLNILGILKKIWRYIHAVDDDGTRAQDPLDWYRRAVPYSLRKMKAPVLVTIAVFIVYFAVGYYIGQLDGYRLPLDSDVITVDNITTGGFGGLSEEQAVFFIFMQNSRVLLLALVFAAISFGVATYIIVPSVFVILGYLASQLIPAGYSTLLVAAVIPHGIVEIPMIILGAAVAFRLGSIVTKPPKGQTVGHAWMIAWGDTIKIAVGVILPMLIIAALLETYVTFPILRSVMQSLN